MASWHNDGDGTGGGGGESYETYPNLAVGSNINVYRNDILVITQTDTTFQSATKHGLVCNNSTGVRFDNFSVLGV